MADSKDNRKNVKVSPSVKHEIEDVKHQLGLKTDSEVILYLMKFFDRQRDRLTLIMHNKIREHVQEMHRQKAFYKAQAENENNT